MNDLLLTEKMRKKAKTDKGVGILEMRPLDFLSLTVKGDPKEWMAKEKEEGATLSLEMYNELIRRGDIDDLPFLDVDRATGFVLKHEGRHRAAALIERKTTKMLVTIFLRERGYLTYYDEPNIDNADHPQRWAKRFLGVQDVPTRLIGQANKSVTVQVDKKKFEQFYSEKETTLAHVYKSVVRKVGT